MASVGIKRQRFSAVVGDGRGVCGFRDRQMHRRIAGISGQLPHSFRVVLALE
jgi:hypothetical protein